MSIDIRTLHSATQRVVKALADSRTGKAGHPSLTRDQVLALITAPGVADPEKMLVRVRDELARHRLVEIERDDVNSPPFAEIAPSENFFWMMDPQLGLGDPPGDAVELRQWAKAGGCVVAEAAAAFGWSVRRMNPALSYLLAQGEALRTKDQSAEYVVGEIILTAKGASLRS